MKVLIVYYSTYGNVYKMAKLVAEGVREVKGGRTGYPHSPRTDPTICHRVA